MSKINPKFFLSLASRSLNLSIIDWCRGEGRGREEGIVGEGGGREVGIVGGGEGREVSTDGVGVEGAHQPLETAVHGVGRGRIRHRRCCWYCW